MLQSCHQRKSALTVISIVLRLPCQIITLGTGHHRMHASELGLAELDSSQTMEEMLAVN